jgi:hypothetical protein
VTPEVRQGARERRTRCGRRRLVGQYQVHCAFTPRRNSAIRSLVLSFLLLRFYVSKTKV